MNEDQLLKDLARRAGEKETESDATGVPAHWQALAAGTLAPAEEERLRARAAGSEEIRDGLELFRPLGNDFQARMVREMRDRVEPQAEPQTKRAPLARVIAFPKTLAFPKTPRHRGWLQMAAAAAMAVAAVGLLWLRPPSPATPLPEYGELKLEGVKFQRSGSQRSEPGTSELPVLVPGLTFQIDWPTKSGEEVLVEVAFFVSGEAQAWRRWPVKNVSIAPTGAVRVQGKMAGDLVLEPGPWTLVAVVGRPSALPSPEEAEARFAAGESGPDDGSWRCLSQPFLVKND